MNHTDNELEMLWVEIDKNTIGTSKNIIYGCTYRKPGTDITKFHDSLTTILGKINKENKIIYHVGDFNIDLLKHATHPPTNDFITINFANNISPLINKQTRITKSTATLIDNIFSNNINSENDIAGIIPTDISDHFSIFTGHHIPSPVKITQNKQKRDYSQKNITKFNTQLSEINWESVLSQQDAQLAYTQMHEKITAIVDKAFPLKTVQNNYKTNLKWLSLGQKRCIKKRHELYTNYLKKPTSENRETYNKYCNILNHTMKQTERQYY